MVVAVGDGKADETPEISAKSKNIKNLSKIQKYTKTRHLEQPNFLNSKANSIFFTKD